MTVHQSTPGSQQGSGSDSGSLRLPAFLYSSYQRYKRDTDRLASWLGTTAQSLGFVLNSPNTASRTATATGAAKTSGGGRLKGKARKAMKKEADSNTSGDVDPSDSDSAPVPVVTALMTTTQLVDMATFIANVDNPPVTVPPRVIDWACRAIVARRTCADWFRSPDDTTAPEGMPAKRVDAVTNLRNRAHEHFIQVLEKVVSILAPRVGRNLSQQPQAQQPPMTCVELLESRFAALAIDGTDQGDGEDGGDSDSGGDDDEDWDMVYALVQETLAGKPVKSKSKTPKSPKSNASDRKQRTQYRIQHDDEDEFMLAFMDYLRELDTVRSFVKDTWRMYDTGELSIDAAGTTTTVAADKMLVKHDLLKDMYPKFMATPLVYAQTLFDRMLVAESTVTPTLGSSVGAAAADRPIPSTAADAWELRQVTYLAVSHVVDMFWMALRIHKGKNKHSRMVQLSEEQVKAKLRDQPGCRHLRMDKITAWYNSLVALYTAVNDCTNPILTGLPGPVLVELNALKSLSHHDDLIPFPTLTTVQLFLDIGDTLPAATQGPRFGKEFQKGMLPHMLALTGYQESLPKKGSVLYDPVEFDLILTATQFTMAFAAYDLDEGLLPETRQVRDTTLAVFNVHPWFTGNVLARAHLLVSEVAVGVADKWKCILFAAYLCHAVNLGGVGKEDGDAGEGGKIGWWPLMDAFMDLVGCERAYFGRVPHNLNKTWDCISMVGGMNGVNFKHRAESLKSRRCAGRYRKFVKRTTMTMESLVSGAPTMLPVRDPLMWRLYDEASPTEALPLFEHAVLEGVNNKAYASALPASARRSMRKSLSAVDLLTQFRSQYTINEPMLKFPLLLLHLQAQRLLVYLRSRLVPTMRSHSRLNHINVLDHELKDVAWHILKTVCNDEFTLRFTGIKDPKAEIDTAWQMLREAKMYIKRLVAEHAKGPTRCGIPGCTCTGGPGLYDLEDMRQGRHLSMIPKRAFSVTLSIIDFLRVAVAAAPRILRDAFIKPYLQEWRDHLRGLHWRDVPQQPWFRNLFLLGHLTVVWAWELPSFLSWFLILFDMWCKGQSLG